MPAPFAVSDETFSQLVEQTPGLTLLDVWAPWCPPCYLLAPIIDHIATVYAEHLQVAKLNVDEGMATARRFGIRAIPALLLFRNGEVIDLMDGAVPQAAVEAFLDAHVSPRAA